MMSRQATGWEETATNHVSDNRIHIQNVSQEFSNCGNKKKQIKMNRKKPISYNHIFYDTISRTFQSIKMIEMINN